MARSPNKTTHPRQDEVAIRAYEIYLTERRAGDHSVEHWLRAERELIQQRLSVKTRTARARREVRPVQPIFASPMDAWCSSLEESEEPVRMRPRAALLA